MKIITTVMSSTEAAEMLCLGELTWVMHPGDEFDHIDFHEWTGHMPTSEEIDYVRAKVSCLGDGQALSVNLI